MDEIINVDFSDFGEVLYPSKSEAPILSPFVRQAVHQWLTEINAQDELEAVGIKPRTHCLMSGPPGCGKTTLAHHVGARLGMPLLCIKTDTMRSKYVGETGNNIASLFRRLNPISDKIILFFDEFDSIASKRSSDNSGAIKEHNSIIGSLLTRIENYKGITIGATNLSQDIDAAIWRRFSMHLTVDLPTETECFAIIKRYLTPYALADESITLLAKSLAGAPPSLIRQVVEGIKRDLILSGRINLNIDSQSVFARIRESNKPHESYKAPPFWDNDHAIGLLNNMPWPPTKEEK